MMTMMAMKKIEEMQGGVVIITALREELDAIIAAAPGSHRLDCGPSDAIQVVYELSFAVPCVAVCATAMGQSNAALLTSLMVDQFRPRIVILAGLAGGIGESVALGDVVVADQVVDYELGKVVDGKLIPRWSVFRPDQGLLQRSHNLDLQAWLARVHVTPPMPVERPPQVHFGVVLSGNKVVADAGALGALRFFWPRALAIEMESAGVALALDYRSNVSFLMVKGVSDRADVMKDDKWRAYAASASAAYVAEVLSQLSSEVIPELGPEPERGMLAHGVDRRTFRFILAQAFDLGELATLVFDLGFDWDEIPGRTKTERIVGLILFLERRSRITELIKAVTVARPALLESVRGYSHSR